jgi:HD-GYP domain-containing protein (c-di-GMP phosphodiesterase class II)
MTSDRPYRRGTTFANAILEIERCAGTQFDPDVVRAFVDIGQTALMKIKQDMLAEKQRTATQIDTDARIAEQHLASVLDDEPSNPADPSKLAN